MQEVNMHTHSNVKPADTPAYLCQCEIIGFTSPVTTVVCGTHT
jgi:hypothetical protein